MQRFIRETKGSASIEFVLLALPLFIPLILFANTWSQASSAQEQLRTLAREAARAFVTSSNDRVAFEVSHSVIYQGAQILGIKNARNEISMEVECSAQPCISPDSRVVVTVRIPARNIAVSAIEYVTPWA